MAKGLEITEEKIQRILKFLNFMYTNANGSTFVPLPGYSDFLKENSIHAFYSTVAIKEGYIEKKGIGKITVWRWCSARKAPQPIDARRLITGVYNIHKEYTDNKKKGKLKASKTTSKPEKVFIEKPEVIQKEVLTKKTLEVALEFNKPKETKNKPKMTQPKTIITPKPTENEKHYEEKSTTILWGLLKFSYKKETNKQ